MTTLTRSRRGARAEKKASKTAAKARAKVPSPEPPPRGWLGAGGGRSAIVQAPLEYRGSTVQVCGMWPFATGAGTPMIGVPLGRSLLNDATLCCDPISWFQYAKLINNPSVFILGKPGLGKSSLIRRMALGLTGYGVLPMFLGDVKGEHVDLVKAIGGRVFRLGQNRDYINVLDITEAQDAARKLRAAGHDEEAQKVIGDAERKRIVLVETLITLARKGGAVRDRETAILSEALSVLDAAGGLPPVLPDLVKVIEARPEALRVVAMDRGEESRYMDVTEDLVASLRSLTGRGGIGTMFSRQSTVRLELDRACVFDLSGVDTGDEALLAASMLVGWSIGFRALNINTALAACGLEPLRHRMVFMDEFRRPLHAGQGMVDRIDDTTRLNRQWGIGVAMCTHTMSDLDGLPNPADSIKAKGFVERSGFVITGGLPRREMDLLTPITPMSAAEVALVTGWQDPPTWNDAGADTPPPGRGNFLIKVGGRPGIPIHVALTEGELSLNDTNKLWHQASQLQLANHGGQQQ